MTLRRTALAIALGTTLLGLLTAASMPVADTEAASAGAAPPDRAWTWPLDPLPSVVEPFDRPEEQWSSGHRGVDLAGQVGQAVHAVDEGVVTHAGVVAGRGVVVVEHGRLRSTYEPVTAAVSRGDPVAGGQVIGVLQGVQSHCLPAVCLHLGAREGDEYIDPEILLGYPEIRLKPLAGGSDDPSPAPRIARGPWVPVVGRNAPVTSGFGPRIHPLTGQSSVHDGVDYGVGCGTPIASAAGGIVIRAGADPVYGHQIVVDHGGGLESRYGHMYADGVLVTVGDRVRAGQIVGTVGSDGWSTACHLHFTVASDGQPVDPLGIVAPERG